MKCKTLYVGGIIVVTWFYEELAQVTKSYMGYSFTITQDVSSPPCVLHSLPISCSLTGTFKLNLANSTNYEVPHYEVFSNHLLFRPSRVQIAEK
jgi:hypothetical protein